MNYRDRSPELELKLNLSPQRDYNHHHHHQRHESVSSVEISPRSSCVSREVSPNDDWTMRYSTREVSPNDDRTMRYSSSPERRSMMLVGCPRCLMYVMLLEEDPKCPKCKSTVLLDFLHEDRLKK